MTTAEKNKAMTESMSKQAKKILDFNIALIKDNSDWNHAYGHIDMAQALGLISDDEARQYKTAADDKRARSAGQPAFSERMAIAEAHRKKGGCERMIYGDYFGNNIRCQTCHKECDHAPVGMPSPEEIDSAKRAIDLFRIKECPSRG